MIIGPNVLIVMGGERYKLYLGVC